MWYLGAAVAFILVWAWNPTAPWSDTITSYPAQCRNGVTILPTTVAYRKFEARDAGAEVRTSMRQCEIRPLNRTTYKLNSPRAEVYYQGPLADLAPRKLVNCTIFSRTDWTCEYPDYATGIYEGKPYSGTVTMISGRLAIHERNFMQQSRHTFYMRKWQWWTATILSVFGNRVRSSLLIPEQIEE